MSHLIKSVRSFYDAGIITDPVWLGFKLFFNFSETSGLLAHEQYVNSALAYLKRIGQDNRYEILKRFIDQLSQINSEMPFLFTNVTGIETVREYKIGDQDHSIDIQTLETIDLKIQSLLSMYYNVFFDHDRWIEVLPVNLRRFSMMIYIQSYGVYKIYDEIFSDVIPNALNSEEFVLPPDSYNHVVYMFNQCEIDMTKSGTKFIESGSSSNSTEFATNNINIKYKFYSESALFNNIFHNFPLSPVTLSITGTTKEDLTFKGQLRLAMQPLSKEQIAANIAKRKEQSKKILGYLKEQAIAKTKSIAEQKAASLLRSVYLGNVYDARRDPMIQSQITRFNSLF